MKRRIFSMLCALSILLGLVCVPAFAADTAVAMNGAEVYGSLQAAVNDYTGGVIVLQADAQDVTVPLNVYLDLNGHNVAGVTVTDGTLYIKDSQTDDYTVADGVCGKVTLLPALWRHLRATWLSRRRLAFPITVWTCSCGP